MRPTAKLRMGCGLPLLRNGSSACATAAVPVVMRHRATSGSSEPQSDDPRTMDEYNIRGRDITRRFFDLVITVGEIPPSTDKTEHHCYFKKVPTHPKIPKVTETYPVAVTVSRGLG